MSYAPLKITIAELDATAISTMKAVQELAVNWRISQAELAGLLGVSEAQLQRFINTPESMFSSKEDDDTDPWCSMDQLISIELNLNLLLPDSSRTLAWIRTPNLAPLFGGMSALDFILRDPAVNRRLVLDYLWQHACGDFT